MKTRPLGRTGVEVTELCLGTMTWGKQNTEAEGHAQIEHAFDAGITFMDTAEIYAVPPDADDLRQDRDDHRQLVQEDRRARTTGSSRPRCMAAAPSGSATAGAPTGLDPRGARGEPQAAPDRPHRPLPDPRPLARPLPLRGLLDLRARDAGHRDGAAGHGGRAGRTRPARRRGQDPPHRRLQRDRLGHEPVPEAQRSRRACRGSRRCRTNTT